MERCTLRRVAAAGAESPRVSSKTLKRSVALACLTAIFAPLLGTGIAAADTHTGFVATLTCGSTVYNVVSPTSPAAAIQDVSSTRTLVFAAGAFFAPAHFPGGKVQFCDWHNLTTGTIVLDMPILVRGAP
jgi:hypothetical protein